MDPRPKGRPNKRPRLLVLAALLIVGAALLLVSSAVLSGRICRRLAAATVSLARYS